jgi:hypothetical protein
MYICIHIFTYVHICIIGEVSDMQISIQLLADKTDKDLSILQQEKTDLLKRNRDLEESYGRVESSNDVLGTSLCMYIPVYMLIN